MQPINHLGKTLEMAGAAIGFGGTAIVIGLAIANHSLSLGMLGTFTTVGAGVLIWHEGKKIEERSPMHDETTQKTSLVSQKLNEN